MRLAALALVFVGLTAFGDEPNDRAKLAGSWQLQSNGDQKDAETVWTLQRNGDAIHITISQNDRKLADFECNVMGRECEIQDSGRSAKVSMYFNGPKLIEIETQGSEVVKRRFGVTGAGDTMQMDVIPIKPSGNTETLQLKRLQIAAEHQ